jgi:hypothetical protein
MTVEPRVPSHLPFSDAETDAAPPRSRRALLAAAVGGVVAVAAGALGRPDAVRAASGDSMRVGRSNDGGSDQTILLSTAGGAAFTLKDTAIGGTGQFGWSSATTGTGRGLYGRADSAGGSGVHAVNSGTGGGDGAALRATATSTPAIIATSVGGGSVARLIGAHAGSTGLHAEGGFLGAYGKGSQWGTYCEATGLGGVGVFGIGGSGSASVGVYGQSAGTGVVGTGTATGVSGSSVNGYGVVGGSNNEAVRGTSANGIGVVGGSTTGTGVYGESASGYAGSFIGDVFVSGTVDGAALGTTIDHPLDPADRVLQLSAIEGPERIVQTGGTVELDADGTATVRLPAWFAAMHGDARYQLTAVGAAMPDLHVAATDRDGFRVAGGAAGARIDWQVAGTRRDAWAVANPLAVERTKRGKERGRYVHPAAHGKAADRSIAALRGPKVSVHEPVETPAVPDARPG